MVVKHQLEVMMQFPKCLKTFSCALKVVQPFLMLSINSFESNRSFQLSL